MAKGSKRKIGDAPPELGMGPFPDDGDPTQQAQYFMEMLDALAQQGTAEAKRIRKALIDAVAQYEERARHDKEEAAALLKATILGMEFGMYELYLKSTRKLRDRFVKDARRLGRSPAGQMARNVADGLTQTIDGLRMMLDAIDRRDSVLRQEASAMLVKARESLSRAL